MEVFHRGGTVPFLDKQEVKNRAEKFLRENWNGEFPVDVDEICDNLGIEIIYIPRLKQDFRVDAYITSDFSRIYADQECADITENDCRYRFSIAHELGHRALHGPYYPKNIDGLKDADVDFINNRAEKQANTFAGVLLCPRKAMLEFIDDYFGCPFDEALGRGNRSEMYDFLVAMCEKFGISQAVAARRLHDEFDELFESYI